MICRKILLLNEGLIRANQTDDHSVRGQIIFIISKNIFILIFFHIWGYFFLTCIDLMKFQCKFSACKWIKHRPVLNHIYRSRQALACKHL